MVDRQSGPKAGGGAGCRTGGRPVSDRYGEPEIRLAVAVSIAETVDRRHRASGLI